ncbi:MAG TPA: ABC transporter ATP-binding protein [Chloroflexi bacterium]|nr:ABC transporter ATP-binding protein [Chloroflexota bacterium]
MSLLKISNLDVAYGKKMVLQDISLEVAPGEILALIGPNGAGKTTLIRAASHVLPLLAGRVWVADQDLARLNSTERARMIAVVPQAQQLGGAFSVEQAVMMGRTAYMSWLGRESEADQAAVQRALQQTQLEDFAQRSIAQLSGGEHQRVLLARALAQSTPVLLLDEPTNHLDMQHQTSLLMLVRQLTAEKQLAVMMAMHDLNLVSFFADKVALLVAGRLVAVGTPEEVIRKDLIQQAYQTPVDVIPHPLTGAPLIFPGDALNQR